MLRFILLGILVLGWFPTTKIPIVRVYQEAASLVKEATRERREIPQLVLRGCLDISPLASIYGALSAAKEHDWKVRWGVVVTRHLISDDDLELSQPCSIFFARKNVELPVVLMAQALLRAQDI